MKFHDNKQRDINMLTNMSESVHGLAAFLFGTRRADLGGQMIAAFAQKMRKITHKKSRKVMTVIRPI